MATWRPLRVVRARRRSQVVVARQAVRCRVPRRTAVTAPRSGRALTIVDQGRLLGASRMPTDAAGGASGRSPGPSGSGQAGKLASCGCRRGSGRLEPDPRGPEGVRQRGGGAVALPGLRPVATAGLDAGHLGAGPVAPAGECGPAAPGLAGTAAVTVPLGAGAVAVSRRGARGARPGDGRTGLPEVEGGDPAVALARRLRVLEAVFAECRELDHQVDRIGRPGCHPAALLVSLHEHRFVM